MTQRDKLSELTSWKSYIEGDLTVCDRIFTPSLVSSLIQRLRRKCKYVVPHKRRDLILAAIHDTYLAFREKVRVPNLKADMEAYLAKCCWNRIVKALEKENEERGRLVESNGGPEDHPMEDNSAPPWASLDGTIDLEGLIGHARLSPAEEVCTRLWLSNIDEPMPYEEIARSTGKRIGTVKVLMSRAKSELRRAYRKASQIADVE